MTTSSSVPTITVDEVGEFITTLVATPSERMTNCAGWTVHELVAHLAAGAAEQADLIEEHRAGRPARPTRTFDEREPAYRALPDGELRDRLVAEAGRFGERQRELGTDAIDFSGRPITAADFAMHSRSECTLHRWDIVGRDDIGWAMLGQPELTEHAITVLSTMSTLPETPAHRISSVSLPEGLRVVLRSEPHDDLVITITRGTPILNRQPPADEPAHLVLEPAARLLALWGRREPSAPITLHATGPERELLTRFVS